MNILIWSFLASSLSAFVWWRIKSTSPERVADMSLYLYLINDFLLLMWPHCQSVATGSHRVVICHISSKDMYSKAGESILIPLRTDLTKRLLPAAYPSIRFNLSERPVIEKTCKMYWYPSASSCNFGLPLKWSKFMQRGHKSCNVVAFH